MAMFLPNTGLKRTISCLQTQSGGRRRQHDCADFAVRNHFAIQGVDALVRQGLQGVLPTAEYLHFRMLVMCTGVHSEQQFNHVEATHFLAHGDGEDAVVQLHTGPGVDRDG